MWTAPVMSMDGAGTCNSRKYRRPRVLDFRAFSYAQLPREDARKRVAFDLPFAHEPLLAAVHFSDDHCRAPRGAFGIQGGKQIETHSDKIQSSFSR